MFEHLVGLALKELKTVKHTKPTTEKIFSYLMKNDEELKLAVLQSYSEKLVEDIFSCQRCNGNETFTFANNRHTSECEATIIEYNK